MIEQAVLLPRWSPYLRIILAKGQLDHFYTFWTMPIMIFSPVANFGNPSSIGLHFLSMNELSTRWIESFQNAVIYFLFNYHEVKEMSLERRLSGRPKRNITWCKIWISCRATLDFFTHHAYHQDHDNDHDTTDYWDNDDVSPTLSSRSTIAAGNGWNADVVGRFDIDGEGTGLGLRS